MDFQAEHLVQLPPALRRQFDTLEQRLWRVDTTLAVAGAVCGLLVSYALVFVSDRFWDTPPWLRLLAAAAGIAVLTYFTYGWLRLWVLKRRDTRALANLVQQRYQRLGDRLLGIVELADEKNRPDNVSPALCRAAIAQVSTEAIACDFRAAVATRKPKLFCLASLLLLLLIALPFILVPEAGANALVRWLWPVSGTPRYTFVSLSALPDPLVVPHGEPFEIKCGVTPRTRWRPATAYCQYDEQPKIKAPVQGAQVLFQVPPQTQNGTLKLAIGDVSRKISVLPTHRPQLRQLFAQVRLPDYLHHPEARIEVRHGRFAALEGSQVVFQGQTTRNLKQASLGTSPMQPMAVRQAGFLSPTLTISNDVRLAFDWKDELELTAKTPLWLSLTAQKDAPPQIELPELARQLALLEDEVLPIRLVSQDDYGVKELGLNFEAVLPRGTNEEVLRESHPIKTGGYRERKLEATFEFSPSLLALPPGSMVTLRGTAADYFPGRVSAESTLHRIFVLSKEEHAKLILEQFEKARALIEELTRKQENLVGDTKQTKDLKPDKLMTEEAAKQIGEQASDQQDYTRQLERLAQDTLKTLKEASRNKAIPSNLLKDWAENVAEMQKIAQEEMTPASQSLNSAQQSQNQSQRAGQMEEGLKKEQEALNSLQDLQKNMAKHLDKLQAKGLAQRLRKVASVEKEISGALQKLSSDPEVIGLPTNQVPPKALRALDNLAGDQDKAGKETRKLQDEIERFHQRTGEEKHGEVSKEMKESQAADEIAQISDPIRANNSYTALMKTGSWAQRLEAWANKLDEQNDSEGDGSGKGGQQEMSQADLERLLALLRLRDDQENLRDRTRLLDEQKAKRKNYPQESARLGYKQTDLRDELDGLGPHRIFAKVRPRLNQAGKAMNEAELDLRKPDTSEPVVATETDAVNLLDDALKQIMQSGQCKSRGAQTLAQMMSLSPAQRAGGNTSANSTDQNHQPFTGDPSGKSGGARSPERVGGGRGRVLPAEFREALQHYFKAVEQAAP